MVYALSSAVTKQWGYETKAEGKSSYQVTYPIAYTKFSVGAIAQSSSTNAAANSYSKTGFAMASTTTFLPTVRWISVGV